MKNRKFAAVGIAFLLLAIAGNARAGQPEENKKRVLDFFRVVFEAQNAAAAAEYLPENYVQHNPLVAAGREGFVRYFKAKWKPRPAEPALRNPPEKVVAEGDFVIVMWKLKRPEPGKSAASYDSYWFDMFRIENGKLAEHWDNATK